MRRSREGAAFAFWTLGLARLLRGDGAGAIRLVERACDIGERQPLALSGLGFVAGRTGDAARAATILAELESRRAHEYIAPMWIGDVLFGLGRLDDAAEQYERAYDERNGFLIRMATSPEYDPIRSHPRILALLRKMKISAYAERPA